MTWGAEVAHVMRKDLRELRWVAGGYLVVVALATMSALRWFGAYNYFDAGMLFVVGLGMLLLASLVQADSPTRPDAFWAIHPHRPSAMMAAKMLSATVLIMLPALLGQCAALSLLAADAGTMSRMLADAAAAYGAWLVFALVISAITPDMRTFILVVIATPIVLLIAAGLFFHNVPAVSIGTQAQTGIAGAVGGLLLVTLLYRTRSRARHTWIAAFVVAASSAFAMFGPPTAPRTQSLRNPSPADSAVLRFTLGAVKELTEGRTGIEIRVGVDHVKEGERITFTPTLARIMLVGGKAVTVSMRQGELLVISTKVVVGRGITAAPNIMGQRLVSAFTIELPAQQGRLEARDLASVILEGTAHATASSIVGSIPARQGASFAVSGTRIAVDHIRTTPDTQIAMNVRSIPGADARRQFNYGNTGFGAALVDTSRQTARMLFNDGGFATGAGSGVVLPGNDILSEIILLRFVQPNYGQMMSEGIAMSSVGVSRGVGVSSTDVEERPDAPWLRNAVLTVVRWIPVGSYRVNARVRADSSAAINASR